MNNIVRIPAMLAACAALASCGLFGGEEDELEPMELVDIETRVKVRKVWSAKVGDGAEFLRVGLRPAGDGNRIYAASHDGKVSAFNPDTGKLLWRQKLDIELSGGPGVGEGLVVVTAQDGFVIALDARNGEERWRADIDAESLARPIIKGDVVVVLSIDNRLQGLSTYDGSQRWVVEQSTPTLTMRGSSTPALAGTSVIAGFDNGRLAAVEIDTGDVQWETLLAPPTGRSDLDRLSDIGGGIAVVGQDVFATGYNGRLASVAAESGQILWAREISSHEGASADWNNVYTVRDNGEIISLLRQGGTESWRDASLLRREVTLPVSFDTTVVVGDFEGYLHFFSNVDGEPVARVRFGKAAISSDPMVMANRLYVQNDDGGIACFEIARPKSRRRDRDIAEEDA